MTISESRIYAKAGWRILPLLMAGWLFAYIDRVNISFARAQMAQELGFSDAVFGLGAGLFFLGYFVFEVPAISSSIASAGAAGSAASWSPGPSPLP